jgi:hypothetical protein
VLLNSSFSIRDNLDFDSNATEESDRQSEKYVKPKTLPDFGTARNPKLKLNKVRQTRPSTTMSLRQKKSLISHWIWEFGECGLNIGMIAIAKSFSQLMNNRQIASERSESSRAE